MRFSTSTLLLTLFAIVRAEVASDFEEWPEFPTQADEWFHHHHHGTEWDGDWPGSPTTLLTVTTTGDDCDPTETSEADSQTTTKVITQTASVSTTPVSTTPVSTAPVSTASSSSTTPESSTESSTATSSTSSSSSTDSTTYSGRGTYYEPSADACGTSSTADDYIVAIAETLYSSLGESNDGISSACGKSITASYNGNSVTVKVVDACESCTDVDLDFSPAAFKKLADLDVGELKIDWHWD
ncbi:unnamed protein product [Kuraishia capsulata CBS 1993]|uniref:RlpA-like protein double-psi beta-barrel domain-containing protein n=1 Tax=Kuraishia capsulata CBS 1993 TaxID=1382522 RepID=W6MMY7_9ASCO|nr:uncharacterized protein KUCA_T00003936001 [Kuraishia capsulata CBS 1993]CDK27956.1 unnamed protein product [Kuraishia capsulata CBS 1993]